MGICFTHAQGAHQTPRHTKLQTPNPTIELIGHSSLLGVHIEASCAHVHKFENIGVCFSRTVSSTAMCFAQALATLKRTAHTKFQVFRARIAAVRSIDRQNQSNRGHNPLLATWWRGRPCKRMSPSPKAPLSLVVPDATSPLGHLRRHSSRLGHGDLGGLPAQADHLKPKPDHLKPGS